MAAKQMPRIPPDNATAMNFFLPTKLHSRIKAAAALLEMSMQDLVIGILEEHIETVLRDAVAGTPTATAKKKPKGK